MGNFIFEDDESLGGGNIRFLLSSDEAPPPPPITVSTVTINETIGSLIVGDSGSLTATVKYSDNTEINSADNPSVVNWSSSNESALTIDESGSYSAVDVGNSIVTVTSIESAEVSDSVLIFITESFDFEVEIGNEGVSYGYSSGSFGRLVSGEFPDGSDIQFIRFVDADTPLYGVALYSSMGSYWNGLDAIRLNIHFDDGTSTVSDKLIITQVSSSPPLYRYQSLPEIDPTLSEVKLRVSEVAGFNVIAETASADEKYIVAMAFRSETGNFR
ncbi:Ig-like domain-containing protein [Vibrio parahaemolyticus]|nr:Ig-like domain-containing protein [Vibrio parahaemolyticus]